MDVVLFAITALISGLVLILLYFKPGYLLGFAIANFYLLHENFWKKKRFDLYDFTAVGEPHKNGFFVPNDEWRLDSPLKVTTLKTDNDDAFVFGTNSKSECLAVHLSRLPCHKVECSLFLRMSNGRLYTLPEEHRIQRSTSEDNTFGSAICKLQCLIPMRKWRIFFNGILKEKCNKSSSISREKHVKFSFIWTASSEIFDFSSDLSKTLISHTAALSSILWKKSITCLLKKIKDVFNAYEQPGMLLGTITIGDDPEKEIYLWGARRRYMGKKIYEHFEFLKIYGNFKNGSILHIGLLRIHQYLEQLPYGYLMKPNGFIFPIENILSDLVANENEEMIFKFCADNKWYELKLKCSGSLSTFQNYYGPTSVFTADMELDGREGSGFVFEGDGNSRRIPEPLPNWDECKENYETKTLPSYCIPFNDELCMKPELCGGKGSSLGNLHLLCLKDIANGSSLKFRVPKGFVISTDAYATFIKGRLEDFLQKFEKDVWSNQGETQSLCQKAQDMIRNAELPEKVVQSISKILDSVFDSSLNYCTFAIRSSATGEDTEQMSAAGQMKTFLGIRGLDQILQAVKNCWASQFSFRAVEYKRGYGQRLNNLMAVVIQEMVPCKAAGVVFTCNPVTGNPSSIHITANWGLGESVVSSSSDPDTITLDRNSSDELRIACKQIGKKTTKIIMDGNSGIRETKATINERSVCCISDEMALQLSRIAAQIEKYSGVPRDIEWGIKDEEIFLFQSRPITTLDTDTDFEIKHMFDTYQRMEKSFWTKANVGEVMPGVSSPLCIGLLQTITDVARKRMLINTSSTLCPQAPYYQKNLVYAFNHTFMNLVGGFLSYDQEHEQRTNSFIIALFGRLIDMEDMRAQSADITRQPMSRIKRAIIPLYFLAMCFFSGLYLKIRSKKLEKSIHIPCEGMNASELLQSIGQNFDVGAKGMTCHMICTLSSSFWNMSMLSLLAKIRGDWDHAVFGDFAHLLSTCKEVESADVPTAIQELGATIAKEINPDLFKKMGPEDALFWLNNNAFDSGKQFKQFLNRHGHRCLKEFDVYTETWGSNPIPLIKMLQNFVKEKALKSRNKEIRSFSSIESKLNVQLNFKNRLYLRWLLPNVRRAVSDRERSKSLSIFTINTLRKPFHRLAEIMVEEGRLPGKKFLFFLSIEEIDQLIKTRSPRLVSKAIRRCKASKEMDEMMFPEICTEIPKPINAEDEEMVISGNGFKMTGVPVSQGIVKAPARVVMNLEETSKIQQGDILITYSTDIGWSPYFPLLSGVVTELGGLISHGAVIAREYGLPCVVSLHGATKAFKSGDIVVIDGSKGTLQKVEE